MQYTPIFQSQHSSSNICCIMYAVCVTFKQKQKRLLTQLWGMSAINKSAEDGSSFSTKVINIVFFTLLLDLLGFTLILPLLPSILDHYAQTEASSFFNSNNIWGSLPVIAVYWVKMHFRKIKAGWKPSTRLDVLTCSIQLKNRCSKNKLRWHQDKLADSVF